MRKWILQWTALTLAWGCVGAVGVGTQMASARAASLEWRFAGLNAVRENKDLVTWREMTGLPEFAGFNSNLVQRVAATLAKPLARGAANEGEIAKALTPIAEDLIAYPTIYELGGAGAASNTWTLAIQIPQNRHELWKTSWDAVTGLAKGSGAKLSREGNWTLLGDGATKGVLEKSRQPTADVLQISGDALLLKKIIPNLKPAHSDLKVSVRGKGLRSEGKVQFAEDLPFKLTPWQIPTNTIREPLVGFTAIQGLQGYLGKADAFKKHAAPNQIFIWNEQITPFSMLAAFKVDDAPKFISDFALGLGQQKIKVLGNFEFDTNKFGLYLTGLPIAVPFLRPAHSNDVNFVYAGAMPIEGWNSKAIPAELVNEVASRTNLLYYDWELGAERMGQIRPLLQLANMAQGKDVYSGAGAAGTWLSAAESKMGNTITEIARTGPREISIVRTSNTGFAAVDLLALVQWVAGPESPSHKKAPPALPVPGVVKP